MTLTGHFGRFEIRPNTRELIVDGKPAALGARAFDLLVALIERRERLVSKDELLELVWPGLVVEENNLQVHVSALRKLLGANAIATIPGRGYRFCLEPSVADVATGNVTDAPAVPSSAGSTPASTTPAAPSSAAYHLPTERTPLIGREAELSTCAARLRKTRLLTLTGIGGTGKTRLALALARGCDGAHRDGAVFVDLAPVSDPDRVSAAVAAAARIDERPGTPLLDVIAGQLATRELLLVLDNCEHVLESAAELADALIERCAALHLVATSREPLGVEGETVHAVPPLALPATTANLADVAASEAVRLFVSRAQRATPSFVLDAGNAQTVADICRRLDGIPLALELAAARVAVLDVAQIAERLDQRFRLLTGGRDRRQQTLEAVVRWSWDHLAADEQQLLARLSVFAGSFALETAVAVAAVGDEFELLDGLARLHAASLLVVDPSEGDTRYRMLDTVRAYARRRLDELGQSDAARDRHLLAFVTRAEATKDLLDARWRAVFRAEVEDFVAAHAWCDRAADGGLLGLRLARALRRKWLSGGMLQLGLRVTEQALARPEPEGHALRGWVLFTLGLLRALGGDRIGAVAPLEEAETIGRALDVPALVAHSLAMRSDALPVRDRDLPRMKRMAAEAVALARTLPPPDGPRVLCSALTSYGNNLHWLDELDAAEAAHREAFEISKQLGDLTVSAVAASNIVDVRTSAGSDRGTRQLLLHIARVEAETRSCYVALALVQGCILLALQRRLWRDALLLRAAQKALALKEGFDPEPEADFPEELADARAALGPEAADEAQAAGATLAHGAVLAHVHAWLAQQAD